MRIDDWDDAYANRAYIPGAEAFVAQWEAQGAAFRAAQMGQVDLSYGPGPRHRYDLFRPGDRPEGLVVFVHGGYWRAFDKSYWSHFAAGSLAAGWAVAMPSYTLAPEASIAQITREIAQAIEAAAGQVGGPIRLVGHSAGGHLVTRQICQDTGLSAAVAERIVQTVSISGVHDLRPLLHTQMNTDFRLDAASAAAESPALKSPVAAARATVWVGGAERPEFIRQSTLLANIWTGLGADMTQMKEPDRHHFDVIEGLSDPHSPLMRAVLG